ncbi:hypothetical protein [Dyella nitratireducens]|uniref:DUF2569 domain-containing protein n=1 Tax=Dyella nitratireducens TaxID=1849580 RepID=A0ABQ1FTQ6_9GAMM|nr:hypothetical protein [Dyella nitratireducens]GGA30425.1 hypothetical protein GCM10010981_19290 [Dyella nitratireducens]GLQ43008.1 hypothetical protein GCM10007902_28580 [Dyella nitratireducens]
MNPEESMRTKRSASTRDDAIDTYTKVASIAVAIGGWAVGMYAGFNVLVPLVATAVVWLAGRHLFSEPKQIMLPAFCVQAGHLVWFVVVAAASRELMNPHLIDIVWLSIGLAWLWLRPGKSALYVLMVYQLLALPYNLLQFSQADFGTTANKVLLVHVIWRCIALFYMARMFYRLGKPVQSN